MNFFIYSIILILFFHYIRVNTDNSDEGFTQLIVGGYRNDDSLLTKFIVSIRSGTYQIAYGDNDICGGAIISKRTILTAAHCIVFINSTQKVPISELSVVAGSKFRLKATTTTQMMAVSKSHVHPQYDPNISKADIGILQLKHSLMFDDKTVMAISIAKEKPGLNIKCTVGGWGSIYYLGPSPDKILFADLQILHNVVCEAFTKNYSKGVLCAVNRRTPEMDTCQGDSGGPLICNELLCGVVSYGIGCGWGYPGIYTDVAYYRSWIISHSGTRQSHYLNKFILIELLLVPFLL